MTIIRTFESLDIIPEIRKAKKKLHKKHQSTSPAKSDKSDFFNSDKDEAQNIFVSNQKIRKIALDILKNSGFKDSDKLDYKQF